MHGMNKIRLQEINTDRD